MKGGISSSGYTETLACTGSPGHSTPEIRMVYVTCPTLEPEFDRIFSMLVPAPFEAPEMPSSAETVHEKSASGSFELRIMELDAPLQI
jgi:hypothetical protein